MILNFTQADDAVRKIKDLTPVKSSEHAAGFDVICDRISIQSTPFQDSFGILYTGICIAIPQNMFGAFVPRSSLHKKGLMMANGFGVIDSDYRGEIMMHVRPVSPNIRVLDAMQSVINQRFGQIIILPLPQITEFQYIQELPSTIRGSGGFGSTG